MRQAGVLRALAGLAAVALLAGLSASPLQAQFECKQELIAGAWIGRGNLVGQAGFPPGAWSGVGLFVFDDQGYATTAIQTNTQTTTVNGTATGDEFQTDFLERLTPRFTVNADCTGRFTYHNNIPGHPFNGRLVFGTDVVCGNGQRECYATFTDTPPPGNTDPIKIIGVWTMQRVEPPDHRLEAKVDAVMRRLGLVPEAIE